MSVPLSLQIHMKGKSGLFWNLIEFKVCLALTCLFPTRLSVMYVLYCHTTQHFFRTSVGMPFSLTFTNHAHCFIHKKGSNAHSRSPDIKANTKCLGQYSPLTYTYIFGNMYCCVMRQSVPTHHQHQTNTCITAIAKTKYTKAKQCNTKQYL